MAANRANSIDQLTPTSAGPHQLGLAKVHRYAIDRYPINVCCGLPLQQSAEVRKHHQLAGILKGLLLVAVLFFAFPLKASGQAAFTQKTSAGFYVGLESGLNWLLNNNSYSTGSAVGGVGGYDFVGPRLELEVLYRNNAGTGVVPFAGAFFSNATGQVNQLSTMINGLYDFRPGALIAPYAGAGLGIAFADRALSSPCTLCSTNFA